MYDAIYPFQKGGGERRFNGIARTLADAGMEVHLYGMRSWKGRRSTRIVDGITVHGICRERRMYTRSGRRSISQAMLFGLACWRLAFLDVDLIDCCGFPFFSLFVCRLVANIRRIPLFSTWHEVWGESYWKEYLGVLGPIGALIERRAAQLPDRIITVSRTTARRVREDLSFEGPIDIIPNGFDSSVVQTASACPGPVDVIFVGRLIAEKGLDLLLEALAILSSAGKPTNCTIVGDGPERSSLADACTRLRIGHLVQFVGWLPGAEDVFALMKAAKVLVLPSRREGFGMVVLEANACGIPAITIQHPSNAAAELIEDSQNGWVVPATIEDLAAAIDQAVRNPAEMQKPSSIASGAGRYSWSAIARNSDLLRVYSGTQPKGSSDVQCSESFSTGQGTSGLGSA